MAQTTKKLSLSKMAYVRSDKPTTHYTPNTTSWYFLKNGDNSGRFLFALSKFPSSLKHNQLIGIRFKFQLRITADSAATFELQSNMADFNASSVTWNTKPSTDGSLEAYAARRDFDRRGSSELINDYYIPSSYDGTHVAAAKALNAVGFTLWAANYYLTSGRVDVKSILTDDSTPYAVVVYDDAVKAQSTINLGSYPGNVAWDPRKAIAPVEWTYIKASGSSSIVCMTEEWIQASAKFYWKYSTESSYRSVDISGNTLKYSIPANTLQTGKTVQWYVRGTDEDGTTTQTAVNSFSTATTQIVADTYPTGTKDNRVAIPFAWHLHSTVGGNYTQSSAKIYWRKQGASSWNSISISGNTQSTSVAAYTFPAGSTIEWYLSGVDSTGSTSNTATATFSTLETTLTITTSPSGSNIDTRSNQTFAWTLSNTQGAVTQQSAILYWRVQGAASYNTISNSTSTKSITASANTFPTASTIQWYVAVTAKDGTVSSSSPTTFSTVSPQITATAYPSGSNIDTREEKTISWKFASAVGDYTQKSASFFWRTSSSQSYKEIKASGSTTSLKVPANTFPTGATVQWYLSGVDVGGHTSTTSATTFNTVAPKITATVYPSGSNVYTAAAIKFEWEFQSAVGKFSQNSAKLYWRASSSEAYKSISASGTTQSLSVPALTFPTASTIQWYLEGVDSGGSTSTTNVASFTTVTPSIKATQYPTGSAVDTRLVTVIKWEFQSPSGNYGQKSATFYWRVQGAVTYNAIAASGTTQQVSVPANTFPTSSTIQWYIAGVDSSNHSSQTSPTTFTTVTPQVKATEYPSGSDVYSGANLTFKWKIESAAGDYTQKSAVFYWRTDTAESYRAINVSGATTQIVVAANTFPTNKTIYWYVSAVDSSNHTSSTSVANFKTQTTQITAQSSPTSGYTDPRNAIKFQWYFKAAGGSIPQSSATFYWKRSTDTNYTSVAASGSTTSVTIAANTFPVASIIDWYVAGTDVGGTSSQTSVYSFSTTAATAYAVVQHPINSGVDGSAPVTFEWTLVTADGRAPSRVVLEWKLPTETVQQFHTIVDTNNPITQYTVDAGYFPAGEINWRVTAYNVDAVIGPSSAASFICIIAPEVSAISATPVPFSTVSWQSSDQEAYQVYVDGKLYGPYFGTEKQFALPDYLRDGVHTIRVRVLGEVDLWSDWVETTVSVQNESQHEIEVQGYADVNVRLEWQTEAITSDFLIYRDDVLIGHTNSDTFTDRYSLGLHDYYVVNRMASGNYDMSEVIQRKTCVEYMCMEMPDGSIIVNIDHALKNSSDPTHDNSREITLLHQVGNRYPSLFKTGFYDDTISCSAVFLYTEEKQHKEFQKLLGEAVIVKIKDGTCCLAVIEGWNRTAKKNYYTAYTLDLKRIEWEDFVDDTQ